MRLRRALLAIPFAVLPAVMMTTPATALTCPMLSDASGDSHAFEGPIYSAGVDILSADIASGTNNVAAVLRLASLEIDLPGNFAPRWDVTFRIGTTDYTAQVRRVLAPFNTYVSDFFVETVSAGPVPFTVDTANATLTWSIPRTLLPDLATPGGTFERIKSATFVLPSAFNTAADVASTTETYVDQTTGCISAS